MTAWQLMVESTPAMANTAALLGRLFIGPCLFVHGLGKLGVVGPGNLPGFIAWLESLGFPRPAVMARLAMLSELTGGALLTVGLLTRPAAALCIVTMLTAACAGHKGGGYLVTNNPPGNEYPVNLAAILLIFILLGPGPYSVDALIFGAGTGLGG